MVAASPTAGWLEQHGVDLGRVDVDAAGDDEVGGAVGEEQAALVVDVAHVAEGEVVAHVASSAVFGLVLEVVEAARSAGALRQTVPTSPAAAGCAVLVADDAPGPPGRPAHGAGVGQPRGAVDERAHALGGGVVLQHAPGRTTRSAAA